MLLRTCSVLNFFFLKPSVLILCFLVLAAVLCFVLRSVKFCSLIKLDFDGKSFDEWILVN
jgi:hypothetical protein